MLERISHFLKEKGFKDLEIYSINTSPLEKSWILPDNIGLLTLEASLFLVHKGIFIFAVTFYLYDNNVIYIEKIDSSGYYNLKNNLYKSVIQALLENFGDKTLYLFARAQPQLLFPESSKNPSKSIKKERDLVKWWASTLSESCLKGHFYVPGESEKSIQDISKLLNCNWKFGIPWDSNLNANQVIPSFPDDVKVKALKLLDSYSSIKDFENILQVTGECGSGRFSGFFSCKLKKFKNELIDLKNISYSDYINLFKTLMDSDFSTRELALKSSQKLLDFLSKSGISSQSLPVTMTGEICVKQEKKRESTSEPVLILSSNLIKKTKR